MGVIGNPPSDSLWDRMPASEKPLSPSTDRMGSSIGEGGEDWCTVTNVVTNHHNVVDGGVLGHGEGAQGDWDSVTNVLVKQSGVGDGGIVIPEGRTRELVDLKSGSNNIAVDGSGAKRASVGNGVVERRLSSESSTGAGNVIGFGERESSMAHFVSLENIARLYDEMKKDRDRLVHDNDMIYEERVGIARSLKALEMQLKELLDRKAGLENRLDMLGRKSEENREKMASIDDKVANIANESKKFEAIVRDLKCDAHDGEDGHSRSHVPDSPVQKVTARYRQSKACERTLYGHTGHVLGLDVNEVTKLIISTSSDHTVRTWDFMSGRRIDTLYGHAGWVHGVAFSKNGERAVSASGDRTVKLWDLGNSRGRGSCIKTLCGHDAGVTSVQIDEDNILVSGSLDKTLRRYDLNSGSGAAGTKGNVIPGHESGVYCLQFWRHGLASGGGDSLVRMHDLRTGLCHRTLAGHTDGAVRTLQFDEKKLISGGADCVLRFWDLRTGGCTAAIETNARINALRFDETRLVVACADRRVKVYDLQSMKLVEEHGGHLGSILCLAGASEVLCTGSSDQTVKMWKL